MSDSLPALLTRWRKYADDSEAEIQVGDSVAVEAELNGQARIFRDCADELEAALAALPPTDSITSLLDSMLRLYAVPFTDALSREASIAAWAEGLQCTVCGGYAMDNEQAFAKRLERLLNAHSRENVSNTPDFILAQYLLTCLAAWNTGVQQRETWYGRDARPSVTVLAGTPPPDAGK